MSDESDKKKGFAGFESLASDIKIEKPQASDDVDQEDEERIAPPPAKPPGRIARFRAKINRKNSGFWAFGIFAFLAVLSHMNDNNLKSIQKTSTPDRTAQAPAQAPSRAVTFEEKAKAAATWDSLPIDQNYRPEIEHYKHSANFDEFEKKINSKGKLTAADYEKYSAASKAGDIDAQYVVATMHKFGIGTKKDEKVASVLYLFAAMKGQPDALRFFAFEIENKTARLNYLMRSALLNDERSQYLVGTAYYQGNSGVSQDYEKAFYWYKQAIVKGNADAQMAVAMMYLSGFGTTKDIQKAIGWALKAGEQSNQSACLMLSALYHDGDLVQKDLGKAAYWLSCADDKDTTYKSILADLKAQMTLKDTISAADMGFRPAMLHLARKYHDGNGVPKDDYRAEVYMQIYAIPMIRK